MDNQLPELKVNMLGRFSITYGEQPITFKRNSATKAVKLLQILLHSSLVEDRGSTGIPRAQLLDDLFGREELANVGNNLRVTVFRLRKMLIEAGLPEYEYIVKEKGVLLAQPDESGSGCGTLYGTCQRRRRRSRRNQEDESVGEGLQAVQRRTSSDAVRRRLGHHEQCPLQRQIFQDTPPAVCLQKRTARIRHHSGTDRQCHRDLSVRRMAVLKN